MTCYQFSFDNKIKEWNKWCPTCKSAIKWSLTSGVAGARSTAYCANNISASRINISSLKEETYCLWEGYVIRQKDGGVRFSDLNGIWISELQSE